jgi:prophage regulatory protein
MKLLTLSGAAAVTPAPTTSATNKPDLIRGWRGICAAVGKSRVQLWRDIREGRFPAPIEIGANSVAWYRDEIEAWKASRPRRTYRSMDALVAGGDA